MALHKGHRDEAAKLGLMKGDEPQAELKKKLATKSKGEVPETTVSDRSTKRIAIKRLFGVPSEGKYTERLAHSVLETGVQSPVIALRNSGGGYDIVAGGKMAAALVKAKELDPRRGEMQNIFIADTKEQADALKYQMQFVKEPAPKGGYSPAVPREITHSSIENLGQSSIVSVKRINGDLGKHSADDIEKLAQSQLKVGNIMPVVVMKKGEGEYDLVHGGLAVAAARRAREIDPRGGEKLRVFIANNKEEANALGYQIGGND